MRLLRAIAAAFTASSVLPAFAIAGSNNPVRRDADFGLSSDVCGEVDADFSVPNLLLPGKYITLGHIKECLCLSTLPYFMATHPFALEALALVGTDKTNQGLTDLVSFRFTDVLVRRASTPHTLYPAVNSGILAASLARTGTHPTPLTNPRNVSAKRPIPNATGSVGNFTVARAGISESVTFFTASAARQDTRHVVFLRVAPDPGSVSTSRQNSRVVRNRVPVMAWR
ncbi:hypothetical protein DXG01_001134 [Tephrocybe rancida]|nr:hypothetical protein DXG01_001134 [Tephrocybe rancida]